MTTGRYALALFELGQENSELNEMEVESKSLQDLLIKSSEFMSLVKDPTYKKSEQLEAIKLISSRFKFTNTFSKFLSLLCFKRRLFFLEKILNNFLLYLLCVQLVFYYSTLERVYLYPFFLIVRQQGSLRVYCLHS